MRTFRFRGKRYRVVAEALYGMCDSPKKRDPAIYLFADLSKKEGLDTCIHEALHAEFWGVSERKVERAATEIADFLWKLGYRKVVG